MADSVIVLPRRPAAESERRGVDLSALMARDFGLTVTLALAICLSVISLVYFLNSDLITVFEDARARLLIARTVLDGRHSGLAQLGGIWPPFPQVFMLPFVWNDFLYYTGIAGAIPSAVSYVAASGCLYKLVARLGRDQMAGLIAVLAFSGPNILYLQSVPMSELPFIACFLAAVYFTVTWMLDGGLRALFLAGLAACVGTLTRYEGWVLVALMTIAVAASCARGGHRYDELEGHLIFFGLMAFFGIGLWLLWNRVIFGDTLYFLHSKYGTRAINNLQLLAMAPAARPTGNMRLSAAIFGWTVLDNIGLVGVGIASLGLARLVFALRSLPVATVILLLLFPLAFSVAAVYMGAEVITNPHVASSEQPANLRYGLLVAPAAGFLAGWLARGRWMRWPVLAGCVAASLITWNAGLVYINDATTVLKQHGQTTTQAGEWLREHYDHGLVLAQRRTNENLLFTSQLPLHQVVYEGDRSEWSNDLADPAGEVRWIVMNSGYGSESSPPDDVWRLLQDKPQLLSRYELVYERGPIHVYRIKSP